MAIRRTKRKTRKKTKYYKVAFKITGNQKKIADRYVIVHKTSLNKLIKKSLKYYLDRFGDKLPTDNQVSKNQLELF